MEDNELDKSEEATPFKLKRAREKGSVARSLDLGFFAALAAAFGFLWISGAQFAATIGQSSAQTFTFAGGLARSPDTLLSAAGILFWPIVYPLIALAAALFALVLILDFAQVGPIFSATPMKPDFNRINPAQGLKRLFSVRALIEAGKAVLKLTAYSIVAWLVISSALANEAKAIRNGMMLGGVLLSTSIKLIMYFALVALGLPRSTRY